MSIFKGRKMKKYLTVLMFGLIVAMLASTFTFIMYYTGDKVERLRTTQQETGQNNSNSSQSESSAEETQSKAEETVTWTKSDTVIEFPILMYHHIADVVDENTLYVPKDEFQMEMSALKEAGYYTLSPEEAYRVLTQNEKPAEKIVWVTLDDGYVDNYNSAVPILTELGMKATINVITGLQDGVEWMSNQQLLELKKNSLISLESHTVDHIDLEQQTYAGQLAQLVDSRKVLNELLNQDTSVICYPSGRYNDETATAATEAGYKLGLTTDPGLASSENGLFALNRVRIAYGHSKESFLNQIGNY